MIKLKELITSEDDQWRKDWLSRHHAKLDEKGRLLAYHGTTPKSAKIIRKEGFRPRSYFSLSPDYAKRITSTYHDIPENKVVIFTVHLPLDAVDFVASDIFSTRPIKFDETLPATPKEPTLKEEVGKEDVQQLQRRLIEKYPQLEMLHLSLQMNGALFIHNIRIKREERKKGVGRKVMDEIKAFADQHGLVITLSPEAESRYKEKLDRFYKSLGFSHNKGRKKDYRYSSFFGPTMIRRPLTEGPWEVVVGSIGMDDVIRSKESRKTHTELGIHRGKNWRYNPKTKRVYWWDDGSAHDKDDEFRVDDHLKKEYGYEVESHYNLEGTDPYDTRLSQWRIAHGYMDSMDEGKGVWGDREEMDFPIIKKGGTVRFGPPDWTRFRIGGVYDAGDVHHYILSQHREFEDDERVDGYFRLRKLDPKQIESSEWHIEDMWVDQLAKSKKPFPPIVINRYGSIIDGGHRLEAAKIRGDKEILVFQQI